MITSGYILGTSTLMDNRDVGLYAPIKDLPGCNPIWTKDMPNVKPTCNTKEPEPPYVSPNAVFENLKVSRLSHPILTYSTSQTSLSHFLRRSTALRALQPHWARRVLRVSRCGAREDLGRISRLELRLRFWRDTARRRGLQASPISQPKIRSDPAQRRAPNRPVPRSPAPIPHLSCWMPSSRSRRRRLPLPHLP